MPGTPIIVNPKIPGSIYPFRDISGCAVVYKLVTALRFAQNDLYKQELCLLNVRPVHEAYTIECVKVINMTERARLTETITPGLVHIENTRLPQFLQGQQIIVWDAPLQKKQLEKIFGTEKQEYSSIIAAMVDAALANGRNTVLYTSREYLSDTGLGDAVSRGRTISDFIVSVCRQITVRPDFIIGKGGITSLTMARDGLGAVSAIVKGQIADGVPVWALPEESRFPGIDFVVFPGNVGNEGTLTETFNRFVNVL